ncbi:MAG: hypothetical protein QOJ49_610 [Actinomycetota bacterium]|nr:hypothetical protein [Actinomycetota bacterium]
MTPRRPPEVVVISWIRSNERSAGVARALGAQAIFMPWATPRLGLRRAATGYVRSALRTWRYVRRLPRGSVVVAMCPPVFNPLVCLLAAAGRRIAVVMDAHSGTFNDARWVWANGIQRVVLDRCSLVIVTNEELVRDLDTRRTRYVTMHDPLFDAPVVPGRNWQSPEAPLRPYAVFPASGADDEPMGAVRHAGEILSREGARVLVTGKHTDMRPTSGVRMLGYLPRDHYAELLASADVVLALTTREATMQRAAYEALEAGRPIVASDTRVLRESLGDAAEYTAPDGEAIASAVRRALARSDEMVAAIPAVRAAMAAQADKTVAAVLALRRPAETDPTTPGPQTGSSPRVSLEK